MIVTTTQGVAAGVDPAALLSGGSGRTLVVLGERPEEEEALPETAAFLAVGGLEPRRSPAGCCWCCSAGSSARLRTPASPPWWGTSRRCP